jgi:Ser/Thr protein kinase RdoA (MazF antagonist)
MSESFEQRLGFDGDFDQVVTRLAAYYEMGVVRQTDLLAVGFEDYNLKITSDSGEHVAKFFSKNRTADENKRYATIIQKAISAGVNHPALLVGVDGGVVFTDRQSGLSAVVMQFVQGKTFYDAGTFPTDEQLAIIATEAVKIHSIDYAPSYLFDSWAIPNIRPMYDKTKDHLSSEGRGLAEQALARYEAIPLSQLPTCLVHGDLIKTNLIAGDDGKIYVLDFACTNAYPRIQELAVMAVSLLHDEKVSVGSTLRERVDRVVAAYVSAGGTLTDVERAQVFNYALAGAAMEYMGSISERLRGDDSAEIDYWENLGLTNLREAVRGVAA